MDFTGRLEAEKQPAELWPRGTDRELRYSPRFRANLTNNRPSGGLAEDDNLQTSRITASGKGTELNGWYPSLLVAPSLRVWGSKTSREAGRKEAEWSERHWRHRQSRAGAPDEEPGYPGDRRRSRRVW